MSHLKDLTGRVFGKLTVIKRARNHRHDKTAWLCHCECGTKKSIVSYTLLNGDSRSCGCMQTRWSHRLSDTPEYFVWASMVQRCHNENDQFYHKYGGAGITVYKKWRKDFAAFIAHMGMRPSRLHSIDRINNDGNYCPGNVRWATRKQQQRNRRTNRYVKHNGKTMCVAQAYEESKPKLSYPGILCRLNRGMSFEQAIA